MKLEMGMGEVGKLTTDKTKVMERVTGEVDMRNGKYAMSGACCLTYFGGRWTMLLSLGLCMIEMDYVIENMTIMICYKEWDMISGNWYNDSLTTDKTKVTEQKYGT